MVPVIHTSMTYWHPAISGALIDSDGKFLHPNFDPEGFIKTITKLTDVQGVLVHAWYKQFRDDAFDHGLWIPACAFFNDKTSVNYITFGNQPADLLPGHLSGLLSCWSACLSNVLHKPSTLPDIHQVKKTVLAMDSGFDMLIPIVQYTHPRYSASRALSMNAPTQEAGMTIANTWEAFKDHKKMKAVYECSAFNLTGATVVQNFIHNCHDTVCILHHFDLECHNPVHDYKWLPDQLASTIQGFFTDDS
jgi:hypothetical protein